MGEDNRSMSKFAVMCWAVQLFITVSHCYPYLFNVRESRGKHRDTDNKRENTGGELKLSCQDLQKGKLSEWQNGCVCVWLCTETMCVCPICILALTCSTQTPDPSSGAQRIIVLSMEAESRLRGCCSSPSAGGDRDTKHNSQELQIIIFLNSITAKTSDQAEKKECCMHVYPRYLYKKEGASGLHRPSSHDLPGLSLEKQQTLRTHVNNNVIKMTVLCYKQGRAAH